MWFALTLTLVAGILGGSVLLPLKFMKRWPFQNSWTMYSFWAYLVMPWVVALATVPDLHIVYQRVSSQTALICSLCGAGWGIAVVLFGISVYLVGLSLASAIIYGASVAVGSLGPLVVSHSDRLATAQGMLIILGDMVMVAGIVLCALAGKKRDEKVARKGGARRQDGISSDPRRFVKGLSTSVAAALLSSLFNIALAYGGEFNQLAMKQGAKPFNAANAQWAYTVTFGYLPNLAVSLFRLSREQLWGSFAKAGSMCHWLWPPVMGLMWIGGTALYGSGASLLGPLGPVIGWPVYMSTMIVTGNLWGWLTGEWELAPAGALHLLNGGILVQIAAIAILSAANR
jgi:L-rhamnose-H+ transport protein